MFKPNQTLHHEADFDNAMYFGLPIKVIWQGELIEHGGQIVKHSHDAVKIGEAYFLKWKCEFRIS
jgi:hypothetical protein